MYDDLMPPSTPEAASYPRPKTQLNLQRNHEKSIYEIYNLPGALSQGDRVMSKGPTLEDLKAPIKNPDGSELLTDPHGRITFFKDAKQRVFRFEYDAAGGELAQVTNEHGTWHRQKHNGRYCNEWRSDNNDLWKGAVTVNRNAYSYRDHEKQVSYCADGSRVEEQYGQNNHLKRRFREDRFGNTTDEDLEQNQLTFRTTNGQSTVIDREDDSLLSYDRFGRLTSMRDSSGRQFAFGNYDALGKPHWVRNQYGAWTNQGANRWLNQNTHKTWFGDVSVDPRGVYSYSDTWGHKIAYYKTGATAMAENGIVTRFDRNGNRHVTLEDGQSIEHFPRPTQIDFAVKNGITNAANLYVDAKAEIKHDQGGTFAAIHGRPQSAVTAAQGGRVVYSFDHLAAADNVRTNLRLTPDDLATIERTRAQNPKDDLLVIETYDPKAHGRRYQLYAGLARTGAHEGDIVRSGDVIGVSGNQGYMFSVRRQRVSGPAVDLKLSAEDH